MKKIYKKILCVALLCSAINSANAINHAKNFEIYGDIMQFLPAFVAIYPLATQNFEGLGWLALSTGSALGATFIIKYSFYGIAKKNPNAAQISQRPNNGAFEGFPQRTYGECICRSGFRAEAIWQCAWDSLPNPCFAYRHFARGCRKAHYFASAWRGDFGLRFGIFHHAKGFKRKSNYRRIKRKTYKFATRFKQLSHSNNL